jgi:futalosine hydrolase
MEQKKKIGLICAVHGECEDILASVRNKRIVTVGTATYISGYVNEIRVTIGITGIGKVNAAYGCGMMIRGYAPHSLVNFGIGGCYPDSKLSIGDVAVAQKEIYADEGVRDESGFQGMEAIGIPIIESGGTSVYNELAADTLLIKQVKKASRDVHCNIAFGTFLTVSSVSGSLKRSKELEHNFGGICENMERYVHFLRSCQ